MVAYQALQIVTGEQTEHIVSGVSYTGDEGGICAIWFIRNVAKHSLFP